MKTKSNLAYYIAAPFTKFSQLCWLLCYYTDSGTSDTESENKTPEKTSGISGNDIISGESGEEKGAPVLETAHVYSVEKQQVAIVNMGAEGGTQGTGRSLCLFTPVFFK